MWPTPSSSTSRSWQRSEAAPPASTRDQDLVIVTTNARNSITVAGVTVKPGRVSRFELDYGRLASGTEASMPVAVVNGRGAGPRVFVTAAIHGDELNGVEVVRRLLRALDPKTLKGTVIAVPILNVVGFLNESRYLPDRRDPNRAFPGSKRGSLGSRLAELFTTKIMMKCEVGIDLHTASNHRVNIPQVRADLDDPETLELTKAFGAPFSIHARLRDGSLRQTATENGIRVLVYEAGEAHRFDTDAIDIGLDGTLRILHSLGMISKSPGKGVKPTQLRRTTWVRARRGGLATLDVDLGDEVAEGDRLGAIGDAFGYRPARIRSTVSGFVIAKTLNPLVSPGDALVHIGSPSGNDRDEPAERKRRRRS
ncbi:MAG: hypothetical protein GEU79_19350 [Acidimicrobiia bacterium]|nr:hypothetical protein [Acidimicrobiia bacterium]